MSLSRVEAPDAALPALGVAVALVVEDELPVRRVLARMLQALGCSVLEAGTGAEAIRIADAHPGVIDLLVVDAVLPDVRGTELLDMPSVVAGDARVLFVTGYPHILQTFREGTEVHGPLPVLPKPFTRDELLCKIRDVLRLERSVPVDAAAQDA